MTREHVVQGWIHRELGGGYHAVIDQDLGAGRSRQFTMSSKGSSFTVKDLCEDCNNKWLSPLEKRVSDVVKRMMQAQRMTLSVDEQADLARWAYRTAIVLDLNQPRERLVPDTHAFSLRKTNEPGPNSLVMLSAFHIFKRDMEVTLNKLRDQRPTKIPHAMDGYSVSIVLGHLVLLAFGWPFHPRVKVSIDPTYMPRLIPLWPNSSNPLPWPPPLAVNDAMVEEVREGVAKHCVASHELGTT